MLFLLTTPRELSTARTHVGDCIAGRYIRIIQYYAILRTILSERHGYMFFGREYGPVGVRPGVGGDGLPKRVSSSSVDAG